MKAKRNAKIKINCVDKESYINHQLLEYYSNLLYETKQKGKYFARYIWYADCKVLIKANDQAQVLEINNLNYLKKVEKYKAEVTNGVRIDKYGEVHIETTPMSVDEAETNESVVTVASAIRFSLSAIRYITFDFSRTK